MDMGATLSGTANFGIVKVSVTGSVSAHQSNTRSSDNSAKYHVDVRATNHGTPEGLARVLDMMAANVAPALVSSSLKDGNGQNLSEQAKIKAERLKALRQEISQIESRLNAARDGLENHIAKLKKLAATQQNLYQGKMMQMMNGLEKDNAEDDKKAEAYSQTMNTVNTSWDTFQSQASDFIRLLADSGKQEDGVSAMFSLKALNSSGESGAYDSNENYYSAIAVVQKNAVTAMANVDNIEKELFDKKAEYSDAVAGRAPADTSAS